jgi:hypothetical protein
MRIAIAIALSLLASAAFAGDQVTINNPSNTYTAVVDSQGLHVVCDDCVIPAGATANQMTTTLSSSLVVTGKHGLIGFHLTNTNTVSEYIMLFDSASAPADGAVTPLGCFVIPAPQSPAVSSTLSMANNSPAPTYQSGIVVVVSSTGCFTKTATSTAYISVLYQ